MHDGASQSRKVPIDVSDQGVDPLCLPRVPFIAAQG
jgi:hypothetical protein